MPDELNTRATYAVIENGIVVNRIVVDENNMPDDGRTLVKEGPGCDIGGTYTEGHFTGLPKRFVKEKFTPTPNNDA